MTYFKVTQNCSAFKINITLLRHVYVNILTPLFCPLYWHHTLSIASHSIQWSAWGDFDV